jgi:transcriptional regulator with XRE-family HTH domain
LELKDAFGKVLRDLRIARGLSQEALALEASVQRNYVSLLERGKYAASIHVLFKLAEALALKPSEIVALVERELADSAGIRRKRVKH